MAERKVQIRTLESKIDDLKAALDEESHEKIAALRPIMEQLEDQILVIQRQMAEREVQIRTLESKIDVLRAALNAESQGKVAALRPILDHHHGQILIIHRQMAELWDAFTTERQAAAEAVQAKVTDIEVRIHLLKQANSNAASFLAPVRRLPIELLAKIFTISHAQSPLELTRVCRGWRAVVLAMPRVWPNCRLSTWTKTDKVEFVLQRAGASPLDVEIDTSMDVFKMVDASECKPYAGLFDPPGAESGVRPCVTVRERIEGMKSGEWSSRCGCNSLDAIGWLGSLGVLLLVCCFSTHI
jgi:F-box-like